MENEITYSHCLKAGVFIPNFTFNRSWRAFMFISWDIRLCYISQSKITGIPFGYISTRLKVTITMETTTQTLKETRMSGGIQTSTPITSLRGIFRIDINNPDSFSQSLVFNKLLHLEKCPLVNPFIVFSCFSNSLQIFHNNNISTIQTFNNSLADVMITPSHKPSPSTREFFQLPLSRFCAFRLESRNHFIMLNPQFLMFFP